MRFFIALALATVPVLNCGPRPADSAAAPPTRVEITSADSARPLTVRVRAEGSLVAALAMSGRAAERVRLAASDATLAAMTPAVAELVEGAGALHLSAPPNGPEIAVAVHSHTGSRSVSLGGRGHEIRVRRDPSGAIVVETDSIRVDGQ